MVRSDHRGCPKWTALTDAKDWRSRNWLCHSVPGHVRARPGTGAAATDGRLLVESDYAEDAIGVVVRTGGEEELVVGAVGAAVMAELNPPEAVDFDGLAGGVAQRAKKSA